ncbi:MAG: hypothetical protein QOE92_1268 [Chloroflexota bacterium]|jgi:hypothetical protein|nr:hypothetical protein [Chloroflexota bacterium]
MADSPAASSRAGLRTGRSPLPIVAMVLAVSIAANIALAAVLILGRATPAVGAESFNKDAWYGVFINNNEAFIGHVASADGQYIKMTDIWYLTLSATDDQGKAIVNPAPDQIKTNINKLGSGLYGPKDQVQIIRGNIRYYTELRNDSPVVTLITRCEAQGESCPALKPAPSPR